MDLNQFFKHIPSINFLLEELTERFPEIRSEYLKRIIINHLEAVKSNPRKFNIHLVTKEDFQQNLIDFLSAEIKQLICGSLKKVINATGVVLHTGMGRAPLSEKITNAMSMVGRYSNLEIDLESGKRGERLDHLSLLLRILTGAEDGLALNNNAAAVLLMLNSVAFRKEVILSRGEMIEIGGSFRLPEVLKSSGCKLLEIGTTNKTHLSDYESAISKKTGAILICHTSNYEIKGFTHRPPLEAIVELAHQFELPVLYDLGSGSLIDTQHFGSSSEPEVSTAIKMNVDLVSFSGDKLLGGPQAGLIVGKKAWLKKCRQNHLLRALRLDKFIIKALQETLLSYLFMSAEGLPPLAAIEAITVSAQKLKKRCQKFVAKLPTGLKADFKIESASGKVGSGAYPLHELQSFAIRITPYHLKIHQLGKLLRLAEVPILTYITDEAIFIDLRAVSDSEEKIILKTVTELLT